MGPKRLARNPEITFDPLGSTSDKLIAELTAGGRLQEIAHSADL